MVGIWNQSAVRRSGRGADKRKRTGWPDGKCTNTYQEQTKQTEVTADLPEIARSSVPEEFQKGRSRRSALAFRRRAKPDDVIQVQSFAGDGMIAAAGCLAPSQQWVRRK